ncbi:HAD-IA family hydrolase [Nocardiopsis alba]|uniref:HAD-IA family hydrolase n=1 Tax=Nocardiopsis alba TaxID=53437 RepID=UPI0033C47203
MRISVDAVLFDIDGTLVDSTPVVERTWRLWAESYGVDPEAILEVSHGRRSEDTIALFLPAERWAAVTSGTRLLMRERLSHAGLPIPEVLVAAEDVSVGKPDPQGYLKAAERLGHAPERCLVVEDAPAGIRAGVASGATVLAVATSHDRAELEGLGAVAVIDDLTSCVLESTFDGPVFGLR